MLEIIPALVLPTGDNGFQILSSSEHVQAVQPHSGVLEPLDMENSVPVLKSVVGSLAVAVYIVVVIPPFLVD